MKFLSKILYYSIWSTEKGSAQNNTFFWSKLICCFCFNLDTCLSTCYKPQHKPQNLALMIIKMYINYPAKNESLPCLL